MATDSETRRRYDDLVTGSGLPRPEARCLLEAASGRSRESLLAHGDAFAPADIADKFERLVSARRVGTPLAYLSGEREFFGRRFHVTPAVLIPRMETEMLVALAIEHAPRDSRIIELGTGSGAIAISIALERPDLQVTATDLSAPALSVARGNADRHGASVQWLSGDWWAAVAADEQFVLAVSNPPYLALHDEHLGRGDLRHEPSMALTSGPEGLDAIESIVAGAHRHLTPGGQLFIEHGWQQAKVVNRIMDDAQLHAIASLQDDQGHWRVTMARTPHHKTVV